MSTLPLSLPNDWQEYTSEGIPYWNEQLWYWNVVWNSKNSIDKLLNAPSISKLLEIKQKVGRFFLWFLRKKYLPYLLVWTWALSLTNTAQWQIDYSMIWWSIGYQTTWDDYNPNIKNGRTKDGKAYDIRYVASWTNVRGQLMLWVSTLEKFEDVNNYYRATHIRLWTSVNILLFSDSEDNTVYYIWPYAGVVNSNLKWKVEWVLDENDLWFRWNWFASKTFNSYDRRSFETWLIGGVEFNVADRVKIGIEGSYLVVPKWTLDNIRLWDKTFDTSGWVKVAIYYNIQRGL